MTETTIVACVGGYVTESSDGKTIHAVDAYRDVSRDLHAPSARMFLSEYAAKWPNHEYINAIRYLIDNCPGVITI